MLFSSRVRVRVRVSVWLVMVMQLHMHMYCFPLSLHHTRLYPSVVLHRGVFCFGGRAYTKMVITDQHGRLQKVNFSVQCHGHYCTVGTTGVTQVLRVKIHLHRRAYAPESFIGYCCVVAFPFQSTSSHTVKRFYISKRKRKGKFCRLCIFASKFLSSVLYSPLPSHFLLFFFPLIPLF